MSACEAVQVLNSCAVINFGDFYDFKEFLVPGDVEFGWFFGGIC
jgi:hypothetical protein